MQCQASVDTAKQGRMLIVTEIDTNLFFEREKDAPEIVHFGMSFLPDFDDLAVGHGPVEVGMIGDALDLLRDLARWKGHIYKSGANCAARHCMKFRTFFALREGQSTARLDRAQTGC